MSQKLNNKHHLVVRFSFLLFLSFYFISNTISILVIIILLIICKLYEDGNYISDMV